MHPTQLSMAQMILLQAPLVAAKPALQLVQAPAAEEVQTRQLPSLQIGVHKAPF